MSISAVYAWSLPEETSTTVVIEFVLLVGNLLLGIVAMCTSTSVISTPGNQRCTLAFRLHTLSSIFVILKFKCAH